MLVITTDAIGTADDAAVQIITTGAYDEPTLAITQAGVGEGLTVTRAGVGADQLVYILDNSATTADHALEVKSVQNATSNLPAVLFEKQDLAQIRAISRRKDFLYPLLKLPPYLQLILLVHA